MEPKKKFWRKNGGGCSFLKLWTKSKLTKQPVVTTCPEYTSMERHTLRILRCMPDVTTIGVHGIGGIGKTSVLKAVIDFPPIKLLFDVVIWSQRFLLLLDDVWEHISLDLIGIPQPAMENGCKMILSTRSRDVCRIMAADRMVQMERLLPEEAWELFQEQLGWIIDSGSNNEGHWLRRMMLLLGGIALKEFSHRNGIYKKLQFSFDRLESLELKSCFLYCAIFPEDRELRIIELRLEGGLSIKMHDLIRDFVSIWLDRQVD
uniref:NB-ARC domain-containing protein n=1 Tax=Fagus sylvatica TaxID=28930 RepID=A0A2N9FPJ9_FAGSY